jgi:multidrug efflux system membrane fusion protein
VVLNQVHPIYVSFAVPEQTLPAIRNYMSSGPLTVEARAPNSTENAASGRLIFVDNAVDSTTGTIKLRGQFANKENTLWPGQFVNVAVKLYDQRDAVVIPSQAIQNGPSGEYVFVVKPDMTAEMRRIKSDRTEGDSVIVGSGLKGGEQVVTRGQSKLTPGARVKVES